MSSELLLTLFAFSPHSPVSLRSALASKGSTSKEEAFLNGPVFLLKQVKSVKTLKKKKKKKKLLAFFFLKKELCAA